MVNIEERTRLFFKFGLVLRLFIIGPYSIKEGRELSDIVDIDSLLLFLFFSFVLITGSRIKAIFFLVGVSKSTLRNSDGVRQLT